MMKIWQVKGLYIRKGSICSLWRTHSRQSSSGARTLKTKNRIINSWWPFYALKPFFSRWCFIFTIENWNSHVELKAIHQLDKKQKNFIDIVMYKKRKNVWNFHVSLSRANYLLWLGHGTDRVWSEAGSQVLSKGSRLGIDSWALVLYTSTEK